MAVLFDTFIFLLLRFQWNPLKIKSAPKDSLVHRLSILLAVVNTHLGGKKAMTQLWAEFVQEMRYRVDRGVQIPG